MTTNAPEQDNLVFKYKSIDANTLSSIQSSQVWFAGREQLNDPYDCAPELEWDLSKKQMAELVCSYGYTAVGDNRAETLKQLLTMSLNDLINRSGVFCVTTNPLHELMWAHYGDSHRGIAIGYRLKQENKHDSQNTHRAIECVSYEDRKVARMSDFYAYSISGDQDAFDRLIKVFYFTRTPVWHYEKERRFLSINSNGLKDIDALIEVIYFGARTSLADKDRICSLVGEDVVFHQVELGKKTLTSSPFNKDPHQRI